MEVSIMLHVGLILFLLWLLSAYNCCHLAAYFISFIYLYLVHERFFWRLRRKFKFEERKQANQRRVLTDSETVRWLNHVVEKIWPICMEHIVSQKILLPIIPWFLEKYKPWTAKEAVVQHLYLGRNPPMFTEMRVLRQPSEDDHLVLVLGMNFLTADDMSAVIGVKLRKRLGFGMWAKLHLTGMHVEGKVLVGVKFLRDWPYLGRIRLCFAEPPYFQMTVKPIFTHGLDVTELPGIAGWLDKLLSVAFEQTLVEPNMLVVDMEKFISPQSETWFSVNVKEPVAHIVVEIIEGADMKPSDLNGLADPYVKGQLGPYRFMTKIQRKTLSPQWHEEFKIPIVTWESDNVLAIEVRDKDTFVDDMLGNCSIGLADLRDGKRHDIWLPLENIKTGRLHLGITVFEDKKKAEYPSPKGALNVEEPHKDSTRSEIKDVKDSISTVPVEPQRGIDNFEPIDVEGQNETGIWVHRPGSEVSKTWEPRKGRSRRLDTKIPREPNECSGEITSFNSDSSSSDDNPEDKRRRISVRRGLRKLSSVFHRSPRGEDQSGSLEETVKSPQYANVRASSAKEGGVKVILLDNISGTASDRVSKDGKSSNDSSDSESPGKEGGKVKGMAKSFYRQAEKSARNIKHALTHKGLNKFQSESSGMNERDGAEESECSGDEPDVPAETTTAAAPHNDSFKKENVVPPGSSDNEQQSAEKLSAAPLERIEDDEDDKPAINADKMIGTSKNM
ncbi:C2 domain-containing protein At1g53590-like isoform X1 [Cucurbita moschata]|uniref:C2 domain-containing protein At1g53590-like isoform X1 n=2 Tax=Cucurbita moschata TaxID=3662 RepID=A0A6J1FQI4_CUCMO|nr:C2 domain-containing protein At1g53590-like isoform X1 [Cucurbita moschata]XP_022940872.1 C2 domain-containing protein At1g53590-like isoform X1 [Cucurbita moschata]XP_022940873.1 C2 domain-containing protein At1g53590-like isoform X1 [Cucurbita moschata]